MFLLLAIRVHAIRDCRLRGGYFYYFGNETKIFSLGLSLKCDRHSQELWAGFALSEKQRNEANIQREDTLTLFMEKP